MIITRADIFVNRFFEKNFQPFVECTQPIGSSKKEEHPIEYSSHRDYFLLL